MSIEIVRGDLASFGLNATRLTRLQYKMGQKQTAALGGEIHLYSSVGLIRHADVVLRWATDEATSSDDDTDTKNDSARAHALHLTRHKISYRWRGRALLQIGCGSHVERELGAASG